MSRRLAILLFVLLGTALADIEIGQSREDVIAALGQPAGTTRTTGPDSVEILHYPQYTISLRNGKVIRIQQWANARRDPASAGQSQTTARILPGYTRARVISRLGQPQRTSRHGSEEWLHYPDRVVVLISGRYTGITRPVSNQLQSSPALPSSNAPASSVSDTLPTKPVSTPAQTPVSTAKNLTPSAPSTIPPPPDAPATTEPRTSPVSSTPASVGSSASSTPPNAAVPPTRVAAATSPRPKAAPKPGPTTARAPSRDERIAAFFAKLRDPAERKRLLYATPEPAFILAWIAGMLLLVLVIGYRLLRRQAAIEEAFRANRNRLRRREPPRMRG